MLKPVLLFALLFTTYIVAAQDKGLYIGLSGGISVPTGSFNDDYHFQNSKIGYQVNALDFQYSFNQHIGILFRAFGGKLYFKNTDYTNYPQLNSLKYDGIIAGISISLIKPTKKLSWNIKPMAGFAYARNIYVEDVFSNGWGPFGLIPFEYNSPIAFACDLGTSIIYTLKPRHIIILNAEYYNSRPRLNYTFPSPSTIRVNSLSFTLGYMYKIK